MCRNISEIYIPKEVRYIGPITFYNCNSLDTVYYGGSKEDWEGISIQGNNDSLINANLIFMGDVEIGDLDGDGVLNSVDSNLLKRVVAGVIECEEGSSEAVAADINRDGLVNSVDSNLLKRILGGTYVQ